MLYNNRIKNLREEKELTLRDIDRVLNLKLDTYGKFENEKTIMPIKHLNFMVNYFNVSLDYIFEFSDNKNYLEYKEELNNTISGQRLKEFRKENNLTQNKLAQILNVDRSTLAKYEKGVNIIATPFLYTICKKYNISADYLLGKIDNPKYLK